MNRRPSAGAGVAANDEVRAPEPPLSFALGALATGLVGATLVLGQRPGLNLLLFAAAAGSAIKLSRPQSHSLDAALFGGLVFGLLSLAVLRAAEWVTALAVLAAMAGAPLALGGASSWGQAASSLLAPFSRPLGGPALVGRPFFSSRPAGRSGSFRPLLRGVVVGGVLVAIFAPLFLSADAVFSRLAGAILPEWIPGEVAARALFFVLCTAGVGALTLAAPRYRPVPGSSILSRLFEDALSLLKGAGPSGDPNAGPRGGSRDAPRFRLSRTEWTVALGLLDLLFAAFVAVQLSVLFAGHDHVLSSTGLTYAEYARQGFAQLVVASALTLLVVAGAVWLCDYKTFRDRLLLRLVLGLLCVLTLVILASALKRLLLYEEAFGYTRARLLAHAIMIWLAVLFLFILMAGALGRSGWLPRTALAVSLAAVLVLGAADPDRLIAEANIGRYRQTGKLDQTYLARLSVDAVPAVEELPGQVRTCIVHAIAEDLPEREPWYAFNVRRSAARSHLRDILQQQREGASASDPLCDSVLITSP